MTTSRLSQLLAYYQEEPNDPFNIYALALEYQKSDFKKAKEFFDLLIAHHEGYVPTYYHAAKFYQEMGDKGQAIKLYEKGIAEAKKQNDLKAARELHSAYQELLFE